MMGEIHLTRSREGAKKKVFRAEDAEGAEKTVCGGAAFSPRDWIGLPAALSPLGSLRPLR